jgi:hypothetical protein
MGQAQLVDRLIDAFIYGIGTFVLIDALQTDLGAAAKGLATLGKWRALAIQKFGCFGCNYVVSHFLSSCPQVVLVHWYSAWRPRVWYLKFFMGFSWPHPTKYEREMLFVSVTVRLLGL